MARVALYDLIEVHIFFLVLLASLTFFPALSDSLAPKDAIPLAKHYWKTCLLDHKLIRFLPSEALWVIFIKNFLNCLLVTYLIFPKTAAALYPSNVRFIQLIYELALNVIYFCEDLPVAVNPRV